MREHVALSECGSGSDAGLAMAPGRDRDASMTRLAPTPAARGSFQRDPASSHERPHFAGDAVRLDDWEVERLPAVRKRGVRCGEEPSMSAPIVITARANTLPLASARSVKPKVARGGHRRTDAANAGRRDGRGRAIAVDEGVTAPSAHEECMSPLDRGSEREQLRERTQPRQYGMTGPLS